MKKRKIRTKRDALEVCKELWGWLAETGVEGGEPSKIKWPGWKRVQPCVSLCPCCQYDKNMHPQQVWRCRFCPLAGYAWDEFTGVDLMCDKASAPYYRWHHARTPRTRKKYAALMVDACERALADLPVRKRKPRKKG